jgi:beta-lactamase regulating signal transducer with metallopeptidase domain/tetratricopeptide (TPR) repeat protein
MNPAIDHLNLWGAPFLSLAGALLWQSTLLALVLLLLDFALRRRVCAAVRYALWLVLLLKLVLPPSLALPTSPAWWWSSARAQTPAPAPQFQNVIINQDDLPLPDFPPASLPVAPPPPALTSAAWSLLTAGGVSLLLLGWLALRWRQVMRTTRTAEDDPATAPLLAEACRLAKIHRRVRVKITRATISPAVCGLWRPVILLPRPLTETLSPEQLRAVLVHELMHLRRGDVWVNFAQALLQIIYWWHPFVWLANARLRRLREEAVDDAVVAALNDEAEIYAPTLLAVARFALQRPLASLGLVGILESRSALRQRIERLVNFPAPRKAGLGLVSAFGLLLFSAVALPMGDAPAPAPAGQPANPDNPTNAPATPAPSAYVPPVANPYLRSDLVYTGAGRHDLVTKLNRIRLASVSYDGWPLSEVLSNLSEQVKMLDPDNTGINFVINSNPNLSDRPGAAAAGEVPPPAQAGLDAGSVLIHLHLSNVWLSDVLDAVVMVADHPIQYSIQDVGIVFSAKAPGAGALATRSFKVDADTSLQGLESVGSASFGTTSAGQSSGGGASAGNVGGVVVPVVNVTPGAAQARPTQGGAATANSPAAEGASNGDLNEADSLVQEGKLLYEMGRLDDSEAKLNQALALNSQNVAAHYYLNLIDQARKNFDRGINRMPLQSLISFKLSKASGLVNFRRQTGLTADRTSDEYLAAFSKLLGEAGTVLPASQLLWLGDQNLLLVHGTPAELGAVNLLVLSLNGVPTNHVPNQLGQTKSAPPDNRLYERTFRVNAGTFLPSLEKATGRSTPLAPQDVSLVLRELFARFDVNLAAQGKALFFNTRLDLLFVRGTADDLNIIERVIESLNQPPAGTATGTLSDPRFQTAIKALKQTNNTPPQLHIKARFLEITGEIGDIPTLSSHLEGQNRVGIMAAEPARKFLHQLQTRPGTETLAEPEVTTLDGRQTQMRAMEMKTLLTGINPQALTPPGISKFEATNGFGLTNGTSLLCGQNCELGPICDVVPQVLSDGFTVNLTTLASETEFVAYDRPTNSVTAYVDGKPESVPVPRPRFKVRQFTTSLNLYDGQTLLLSQPVDPRTGQPVEPSGKQAKHLLVLVTVILVDAAGNRLHTADQMPFARDRVPPQEDSTPVSSPFPPGPYLDDRPFDHPSFDQDRRAHGF